MKTKLLANKRPTLEMYQYYKSEYYVSEYNVILT